MEKYCHKCEKDVELIKDESSNAQICEVCGTIIIHTANYLPQGTMLGGFEIIGELGRGGMGVVYKARQLNLERNVALKVLSDDLANDHEFVNRFFKEARAAASLNHPNIVQVFDAGKTPEGISFFAMELIEGETLECHIEKRGKLPPKEALKVAIKIAEALDYAWEFQKLTHGDIKPDNIILNSAGDAKLADLGLAKFVHDEFSEDGIMATPLYAPPEIIRGDLDSIGFKSDMYSFGATLYQMLTGVPPFPDDAPEIVFEQHLNETPVSITDYNDQFAPSLVRIIEQMLAKNPDDRPETWKKVYKAFKKIREPEISGKVFHTHTEKVFRAHTHSNGTEQHKTTQGKSVISLVLKSLIGLIAVLIVAIAALVVIDMKKTDTTDIADTRLILNQWDAIKQELAAMEPEAALAKVQKFISDNNNQVPLDTMETLKILQSKSGSFKKIAEKRALEKTEFAADVVTIKEKLKTIDTTSRNIPIDKVISLHRSVEDILKKTSDFSYLSLGEEDKKYLNGIYAAFSGRVIKHKELVEKLRKEKIAEEQQKKLEAERQRLLREAEKRDTELALCRTIDNYYMAIAEFKNKKKRSVLENSLKNWDEGSETISSAYSVKIDFINVTVIPNAVLIRTLLQSKGSYFIDQPLPEAMCSRKLKHYTVKEISERRIKLVYNKENVTIGDTLLWTSIPPKHLILMLKERILNQKTDLLDDKEKSVVLAFSLLFSPDNFLDIFAGMKNISKNNRQHWRGLKNDFEAADIEAECIEIYATLRSAIEEKEFSKAVTIFQNLLSVSKGTKFAARYKEEFFRLKKKINKYRSERAAARKRHF